MIQCARAWGTKFGPDRKTPAMPLRMSWALGYRPIGKKPEGTIDLRMKAEAMEETRNMLVKLV